MTMSEDAHNTGDTEHEVAHQVAIVEETFVGTKDTGTPAVTDIKLPSGADFIHPEAADRLRREHGIQHLHKFGVYVAPERTLETDTEQ